MERLNISSDFTMEDIRRIREHNSARHKTMTRKEVIADINKGAEKVLKDLADRKSKQLEKVSSSESQ